MIKSVTLYADLMDPHCSEAQSFLERQEIRLKVHDMRANPLDEQQLAGLIRHLNIRHFVNPALAAGKRAKIEKVLQDRDEVIRMMAEDNEYVGRPLIVCGRLMTVGYSQTALMDMLEIKSNGDTKGKGAENAA